MIIKTKEIFECRECNPDDNPNECYLSSVIDIVTGKVDFKCVGKIQRSKN